MLLLPVGVCALAAHLMRTTQFAVIGGEDDDRRGVEAVGLQFLQQPNQMTVAVSDAVEVVVLQDPPSTVFVRPLTEQNVLSGLVFPMGARAARRVERLMARRRQRDLPIRKISFVLGRAVDRVGRILALD